MTAASDREGNTFDPMDCAFCCVGGGRRLPNGALASCPLHGGPIPEGGEDEIRRDERRKVAEEIARAIEVAAGDRCPTCGGRSASTKWKGLTKTGRCGGGHSWSMPQRDWAQPAEVARKHATAPAVSRG
ncbi:hypothetical protein ACIODS_11835 [Micromonospora chalcea]|uniref:hypothetical protein n=1 Tax=Micromonospora chalcea TaxID=1874 RepID=UPI00380FEADA